MAQNRPSNFTLVLYIKVQQLYTGVFGPIIIIITIINIFNVA